MPTINIPVPASRNGSVSFTLPAATEQDVAFTLPAGLDRVELTLYPVGTDVKVAPTSVAGGGPANASKTPVPTAGFPVRFQRKNDEVGAVALTLWFFSTAGSIVGGWTR